MTTVYILILFICCVSADVITTASNRCLNTMTSDRDASQTTLRPHMLCYQKTTWSKFPCTVNLTSEYGSLVISLLGGFSRISNVCFVKD